MDGSEEGMIHSQQKESLTGRTYPSRVPCNGAPVASGANTDKILAIAGYMFHYFMPRKSLTPTYQDLQTSFLSTFSLFPASHLMLAQVMAAVTPHLLRVSTSYMALLQQSGTVTGTST